MLTAVRRAAASTRVLVSRAASRDQRRCYGVPAKAEGQQDEDDRSSGGDSNSSNSNSSPEPVLPFSAIPQPRGLPFLGNALLLGKHQSKNGPNELALHTQLYKDHGPIYKLSVPGGLTMVYVSSPEYDKVYRAEGRYPVGTAVFVWQPQAMQRRNPQLYEGENANSNKLTSEGEQWRANRHKMQPFVFSMEASKSHQPDMVPAARRASELLPSYVAEGRLKDLTHRAAFDMFCAAAVDLDTGCVDATSPTSATAEALEFVRAVEDSMAILINTIVYKPLEKLDFVLDRWGPYQRYEQGMFDLLRRSRALVDRALRDKPDGNGVVQHFVRAGNSADEASKMFCGLLLAAVDTTGDQTLRVLSMLAEHPDKQAVLRAELEERLGGRDLDPEDDLPYLKAVMRETQRFRPFSVAGIVRKLEKPVVLHGYEVPAGVPIFFSAAAAIIDERYAGAQPETFQPERYLPEAVKARKEAKNTFLDNPVVRAPFSRGARSCLGMRIAQQELDTIVARVVQDHVLTLAPGEDRLKPGEREYRMNLGNLPHPLPRFASAPAV